MLNKYDLIIAERNRLNLNPRVFQNALYQRKNLIASSIYHNFFFSLGLTVAIALGSLASCVAPGPGMGTCWHLAYGSIHYFRKPVNKFVGGLYYLSIPGFSNLFRSSVE